MTAPHEHGPRRKPAVLLVPVLLVAALLVLVETVGTRLSPPDRLDRILQILERDPDLLWRLRAGLVGVFEGVRVRTSDRHLRGASFAARAPRGVARIVCLGASPTFGWGVAEGEAYPAVLERLLRERGVNAEVINGGVPGYSTWQASRWFRRDVLSWSPDAITVDYVLNDLDRFRFFGNDGRPDAAQKSAPRFVVGSQNILNRTASFRLFRRGVLRLASRERIADVTGLPRRVPPEDFRRNLLAIEAECRLRNVGLVFVRLPVNLPFHRLRVVDAAGASAALSRAAARDERGEAEQAVTEYREAVRLDPSRPETYERLARALRRTGRGDEARKMRDLGLFAAAFRDHPEGDYYRVIEEVAAATGRPLADIVAAFRADGRDEGLWNSAEDPFHPNAAGHRIIAERLAGELEPVLRPRESPHDAR